MTVFRRAIYLPALFALAIHPVSAADTQKSVGSSKGSAASNATDAPKQTGNNTDWKFLLGLSAMYAPEYEGSKYNELMAAPTAEVSWRETVSLSLKDGLSAKFKPFRNHNFSLGGGVGYWRGRKESADKDHDDALRGLGNISGNAVANLRAAYEFGPYLFGARIERDMGGDRDGTTIKLNGGYKIWGSEKLRVKAGISATWADDNYMMTMFGISAEQSRNSPHHYAVYTASAGIKDVGVHLDADYSLFGNVSMTGQIGYQRLVGDTTDSPIVTSENQYRAGLGLVYRF